MSRRHFRAVPAFCLLAACLTASSLAPRTHAEREPFSVFFHAKRDLSAGPDEAMQAALGIEGRWSRVLVDTGLGDELIVFKHVLDHYGVPIEEAEDGTAWARVKLSKDAAGNATPPYRVLSLEVPSGLVNEAGAIGWQWLKLFRWELNYPEHRLKLHDEIPQRVRETYLSFPIKAVEGGALAIQVPVNGEPTLLKIDTGSKNGLALGPEAWEAWVAEHEPAWMTLGAGYSPANASGFFVKPVAVGRDVRFGELGFGSILVGESFSEINLGGNPIDREVTTIGRGALANRALWIDGPGERVYFGPLAETKHNFPIAINRAQATYIPTGQGEGEGEGEDDNALIAHVLEGGVAHRAGLRSGDKIIMVNGVMAHRWRQDASVRPSAVLKDKPGARVRLFVERDGKQFPVTFELASSPMDADAADEQP